ncbi:Mur ligase family protein [Chryseomicrobium sp. FSL W7-1435]|uniref:bifunctional folylpolyglutamate synthase/dihydrofolate synthase n=1 Tax=Chryseomicrobium sp. FSL W7-1435 TaxID=2921704 RepID=UPI00315B1849
MKIPGLDVFKEKWGIASRSTIEPGLDRMQRVLKQLGNPETFDRIIHVAGTNGKGSTIAFLKALCESHGIRYGAFQSPAIVDVHDQLVVNGQPITPKQLDTALELLAQVEEAKTLTDFELLTICAFIHFRSQDVDVWILETGMGGRFDSTNVVPKSIAVITSLSIDHTNFLGTTLDEIGYHKAGIIKEGSTVVLPETIYLAPFEKEAAIKNATLFSMIPLDDEVELSLVGAHQRMNATLACTALSKLFTLTTDKLLTGLKGAYIPFRMEKLSDNIYLDGAHNVESAQKLVETIRTNFQDKPVHIVMGILADKEFEAVLRELEKVAETMTFVEFSHERALEPNRLVDLCRIKNKRMATIDQIELNSLKSVNDRYFITGSLYFLSEWRFKNSS